MVKNQRGKLVDQKTFILFILLMEKLKCEMTETQFSENFIFFCY